MSRGGRGAAKSGVNILANALNIQRNEINSGPPLIQAPPLFPVLDVQPLPSVSSNDFNYMVESKQEFLRRMRESPYYLKEKTAKCDVERYSDKYKKRIVEPWTPHWKRMPKVLWPRSMLDTTGKPAKRFKSDLKNDPKLKTTLEALEQKEQEKNEAGGEGNSPKNRKKLKEDEEELAEKNEDEEEMSDDDYLEEQNDYVQNYFDNGEEYLDESDDNIDGGEATF